MADKKLKKKLAKMTEEQRIAFLEQMRLEEEEKQKQKEEMLSRYLKVRNNLNYSYIWKCRYYLRKSYPEKNKRRH